MTLQAFYRRWSAMNDNLHPLRDTQDDSLVRLLFQRVRGVCGSSGDFGQAAESSAGGALVPTDAPGQADAGSNPKPDQEPIA